MILSKKEKSKLAHELLYKNLGNATESALLNLNPAHICYVALHFVIGIAKDSSPNEKEARQMINDVIDDVMNEETSNE